MTPKDHDNYALELLLSLSDDHAETDKVNFIPDPTKSRNAAGAMTAILCQRLFNKSQRPPTRKANKNYEWGQGIFNSRNIADRGQLWTNIRRDVANAMHNSASSRPVTYLLACSDPSDAMVFVWAIPEPLLFDSLSSLPQKSDGKGYSVEIQSDKQRIEHYTASPDLTKYFQRLRLSQQEKRLLDESRVVDASRKREKASERLPDKIRKMLVAAGQHADEAGGFNLKSIADARRRVLSSIVRRLGQPKFRRELLASYNGKCAITGCEVDVVLDAAHIIPYMGPDTNHPANGLLLRTDLHSLFDLKLIAVEVETMTVLVSPALSGTCYAEYHGRRIAVPHDIKSQPSREALEKHRQETGLVWDCGAIPLPPLAVPAR